MRELPIPKELKQAAKLYAEAAYDHERAGDIDKAMAAHIMAHRLDPELGDYSDRIATLYLTAPRPREHPAFKVGAWTIINDLGEAIVRALDRGVTLDHTDDRHRLVLSTPKKDTKENACDIPF